MTQEGIPGPPPAPDGHAAAPLTIVGIGASAGGLKALQRFFESVPADSGMAYVVVMHLTRSGRAGSPRSCRTAPRSR
jgi:two-component system CheB/CheR fusion protein